MSFVVNYDSTDHIVYTVADGDLTIPICTDFSISAYHKGEEHDCKRFIFDLRDTTSQESISNIAQFVCEFEKIGVRTRSYIAVIANTHKDKHHFFDVMTKKRGYSRIRYFYDMATAKTWILSQHD